MPTALLCALASCACTAKKPAADDVKAAPPCPKVGHAIDLCDDIQVKLLAADFFRAVGQDEMVTAQPDHVFCRIELEWPRLKEGSVPPLFTDASGTSYRSHEAAERAWRAMQPEVEDPAIRPQVKAGDREVFIFEFPAEAAREGLTLRFEPPCESDKEAPHFCLGRHQIVME